MKPCYEQAGVAIYMGDVLDVLPAIQPKAGDLTIADPPYGMQYRPAAVHVAALAYEPVRGDERPFDPTPLLGRGNLIAWGANYYAHRLPPSGGWLGWDKRTMSGLRVRSSEAEFAWTNCIPSPKLFRYLWSGAYRDGEPSLRGHPTMKPEALMGWCIGLVPGAVSRVLEPYCGLGPALAAAHGLGLPAIGIEIEERYCEIAAKRLAQGVLDFKRAAS